MHSIKLEGVRQAPVQVFMIINTISHGGKALRSIAHGISAPFDWRKQLNRFAKGLCNHCSGLLRNRSILWP